MLCWTSADSRENIVYCNPPLYLSDFYFLDAASSWMRYILTFICSHKSLSITERYQPHPCLTSSFMYICTHLHIKYPLRESLVQNQMWYPIGTAKCIKLCLGNF